MSTDRITEAYLGLFDPGDGYRRVNIGEVFVDGDEFWDGPNGWQPRNLALGQVCEPHHYDTRRKCAESEKPPLGLKPKYVAHAERRLEVEQAIRRFIKHELDIPHEWVAEYLELAGKPT